MRIDVLSELPGPWRAALGRWSRFNWRRKPLVEGRPVPDRNEEYLLYQTLVGAWPPGAEAEEFAEFRRRIADYMRKAVREAKVNSSWIRPNLPYEEALQRFIDRLLETGRANLFLADLAAFQQRVGYCGMLNSLSQTLLKMTVPGIPDFYQGTELWDLSLVDPDNRRPVDFVYRRRLLAQLRQQAAADLPGLAAELAAAPEDGRVKLFLIRQALALRNGQRDLFEQGDYRPLEVAGERAEQVCSFARTLGEQAVLVVAPRLFASLAGQPGELPLGARAWGDTRLLLPEDLRNRKYRQVLTGRWMTADDALGLAAVLAEFPVALLQAKA